MSLADISHELAGLTRRMLAGELTGVEGDCAALLQRTGDDPRLLCLLGRVQRLQGKRGDARANLLAAHRLAPQARQVLSELGYLALEEESYAQAENYFLTLVRLQPGYGDAWFNIGVARRQLGRHAEAVAALEKCLQTSGDRHEQVHTELGTAHIMQRHERAALGHFEQALALRPDYAPALHGVGMVRSAFGEFDAAADYFRRAIRSDPDFVASYELLVSIQRFENIDDPDIQIMEKIVNDTQRSAITRETLHFSLGKVYDDAGEHDRAFTHFRQANLLKKARLPGFSRQWMTALVDRLIATFATRRQFAYASDSALPVLVFGMPRSGTTLVEQVLASHSQIDAGGEQSYIERATRDVLAPYPDSLSNQPDNVLRDFAAGYTSQLQAYREHGAHVTDKLPANFFHAGLVSAVFPRARLIYCRRQRLDNALSIYFQNMPAGHHYANDLEDIDYYYREHERLMNHWQSLLGDSLLTVDYEDMIGDFESGARRLIDFCGLDWEAQCLDHRARKGPVATLSLWQVRQPIYNRSVGRWQHYADHLPATVLP